MIIFDTETTDLMRPEVADITWQPHIIEIAMVKLDENWREIDRYATLIKPGIPLNEEMHKNITGITSAQLETAPTFLEKYDELISFCIEEHTMIAHNMPFDLGVLVTELRRIGKEYAFPYPYNQICTVERTRHLKGKRLTLVDLYKLKLNRKLEQTHRALDDVLALAEIVRFMKIS